MQCMIVTGYIPIPGHPRSAKEYGELGEKTFPLITACPVHPFYEKVEDTWLMKLIQKLEHEHPLKVSHSSGDNSAKNTLAYHCVQHQKFGFLLKAKILYPDVDTFIWVDYGIARVWNASPNVLNTLVFSVRQHDFAIPGCWDRQGLVINDYFPCWRFCGGLMVVPRQQAYPLYKAIKKEVTNHIKMTGNVTWEVNTLAAVEPELKQLRWYYADHNEGMAENYAKDLHDT